MKLFGRKSAPAEQDRSFDDSFLFGGNQYSMMPSLASSGPVERSWGYSLQAYAYRTNPIVFACMDIRAKLFSEVHFQWRAVDVATNRPSKYFGNNDLLPLEVPYPNGNTGKLLSQAINDVDLHGNSYLVRRGGYLFRLRPDWVEIIIDSPSGDINAIDARIAGYIYRPGGQGDAQPLLVEEVCHWAPVSDPFFRHLGMSPLTPALTDIYADDALTDFKMRYLANGASPSTVFTMPAGMSPDEFELWVSRFKAEHGRPEDKGKPLFISSGTSMTVVGNSLSELDMKSVQGAGETRIASCLGVPSVLAGLSEGLEASSYAYYSAARRRLFDGTLSPLLHSFAAALETVLTVPGSAFLTYDARDVPWLQSDVKDDADIQSVNATAINTLITAGFDPDSVVTAVTSNDLGKLTHTGMTSVQLLAPGSKSAAPEASNGHGDPKNIPALASNQ